MGGLRLDWKARTRFSWTITTTIERAVHDFQSRTSRRSIEGLLGRPDCQGSGSPPSSDESDIVAHSERTCRHHRRDVAASFGGARHVAGVLAEDAGTA